MSCLTEKLKIIKNTDKYKNQKITIDIEKETIKYIEKEAKKYNVSFNVMINYIFKFFIIKYYKKKYMKEFKYVFDSIEFEEFKKNNVLDAAALVIDYKRTQNKYVVTPFNEHKNISKRDLIKQYLQENKINKLDDMIDEYIFYNYQVTPYIENNYFKAMVIDPIDLKENNIFCESLSKFSINECYNKLLNQLKYKG